VKAFPCGTATYLQTPASPHVWGLFLRRSSGLVLRFTRRPREEAATVGTPQAELDAHNVRRFILCRLAILYISARR
jgi:hypothetical protein